MLMAKLIQLAQSQILISTKERNKQLVNNQDNSAKTELKDEILTGVRSHAKVSMI